MTDILKYNDLQAGKKIVNEHASNPNSNNQSFDTNGTLSLNLDDSREPNLIHNCRLYLEMTLFIERQRISGEKVNNVSVIDEVESTNANIEDQAQRKTSQMSQMNSSVIVSALQKEISFGNEDSIINSNYFIIQILQLWFKKAKLEVS